MKTMRICVVLVSLAAGFGQVQATTDRSEGTVLATGTLLYVQPKGAGEVKNEDPFYDGDTQFVVVEVEGSDPAESLDGPVIVGVSIYHDWTEPVPPGLVLVHGAQVLDRTVWARGARVRARLRPNGQPDQCRPSRYAMPGDQYTIGQMMDDPSLGRYFIAELNSFRDAPVYCAEYDDLEVVSAAEGEDTHTMDSPE